jgi:predicted Zn-dependent protease
LNFQEVNHHQNSLPKLFGSTPAAKKAANPESDIDENLISETLAKIYLTQGENNEAMRVYEKLIKKYPLKKSIL